MPAHSEVSAGQSARKSETGQDGGQTPKEKLTEVQNRLQQDNNKIKVLTEETKGYQSDITDLTKAIAEIDQQTTGLDQILAGLGQDKDAIAAYPKSKWDIAVHALKPEGKTAVDDAIAKYDAQIDKQAKTIEDLGNQLKDAVAKKETAQKNQQQKQRDYETIKNRLKSLKDNIQKLKHLKGEVDASELAQSYGAMYFLLELMKDVLDHTDIPAKEQHKKDLNGAALELYQANHDLRDASTAVEKLTTK